MQLSEIFTQAILLPINKRQQFIHDSCNGDQIIINEVNGLIESESSQQFELAANWTRFINEKIVESSVCKPDFVGQVVGAFRIEELIGQGGMGDVYRASRNDRQFEQNVAIKVLDRRLEHIIGKESLIREAAFMAKLSHPNIGKVYDAGVTEEGYSFIIMEFVQGELFSEVLEGKSINDNLELYTQLCSAIHYAHQMQVVHADLKPSNILVEDGNQVKVLDFGVARMFNSHSEGLNLTYAGYIKALTTKYSSPEVLAGGLPNILSDVYSLGVVFDELINISSSELTNSLSQELKSIVTMATEDTPKRYQSVLELKSDIDRFRKGYVTQAHNIGNLHSIKKFIINRHPVSSIAASLVVIITVYLVSNLFIQHQALKIAKAESDLVVSKFGELLELADLKKTNGKELSAKDLLNNAQTLVKQDKVLNKDSIANLKVTLAHSYESLGDRQQAIELYKAVIENVASLSSKSTAYKAGANLIQIYLYSNQFDKIQKDTVNLVEQMPLVGLKRVPRSLDEALFYHRYLNGMKYFLYQSMPSEMGEEHIELLRNIRIKYWSDLPDTTKGNISGALGGAIMNQIPIGIEFSFEQMENSMFQNKYHPLLKEAIWSLEESITFYSKQNKQVEVLKKQIVIGRAYIELDDFEKGKFYMESALELHQKIVGSEHPNNIQFFRMIAGFFSFDSPKLSVKNARLGVMLAMNNSQVNETQKLHAQEALLYTLYNAGSFNEYHQIAGNMFETYLSLSESTRSQQILLLIAKTLQDYISRLGATPHSINELVEQIENDYSHHVVDQEQLPTRTAELLTSEFISYLKSLTTEANIKASHIKHLFELAKNNSDTARNRFFNNKAMLDAIELSMTSNLKQEQSLPSFIWGKKEKRQSVNRLEVLLKEVSIFTLQNELVSAEQQLNEIKPLIEHRKEISNSAWQVLYDVEKMKLDYARGDMSLSKEKLEEVLSQVKSHYPENSWIIKSMIEFKAQALAKSDNTHL